MSLDFLLCLVFAATPLLTIWLALHTRPLRRPRNPFKRSAFRVPRSALDETGRRIWRGVKSQIRSPQSKSL